MFSGDLQSHIKIFLKVKSTFLSNDNLHLFGKLGVTTHVYGFKIITKYEADCDTKNPKDLICLDLENI